MNNQTEHASLPWYRYSMVWMVILLPTIVVIAAIITMTIAFKHAPVIVEKIVEKKIVNHTEQEKSNLITDHQSILSIKD